MSDTNEVPSFIGIDIAQSRLDVHVRPAGTILSVARDPDGLATLVKHSLSLTPKPIVLEAASGLEISISAAVASAGLPLAVVNPRQIRDFARSCGQLAKTDAPDARAIALFAERIQPQPRPVPDEEALTDLVAPAGESPCLFGAPARPPGRWVLGRRLAGSSARPFPRS